MGMDVGVSGWRWAGLDEQASTRTGKSRRSPAFLWLAALAPSPLRFAHDHQVLMGDDHPGQAAPAGPAGLVQGEERGPAHQLVAFEPGQEADVALEQFQASRSGEVGNGTGQVDEPAGGPE